MLDFCPLNSYRPRGPTSAPAHTGELLSYLSACPIPLICSTALQFSLHLLTFPFIGLAFKLPKSLDTFSHALAVEKFKKPSQFLGPDVYHG